MVGRNRFFVTHIAGIAFAAVAIAPVAAPHNAVSAAPAAVASKSAPSALNGKTLQATRGAAQATRMDDDDGLGALMHHRYP